MKHKVKIIAMLSFFCFVMLWADNGSGVSPVVTLSSLVTQPKILTSTDAVDFSSVVKVGESDTATLMIYNDSDTENLIISSFVFSDTDFSSSPTSATISPRDSMALTITFSPSTNGSFSDTLTINSNDTNSPQKLVTISTSASSSYMSGVISTNTNWTKINSPYFVDGFLAIDVGVALTIEAGVVVEIDSMQKITVDGTLNVQGAEGDSVIFRGEGNDRFDRIYFRSGSAGSLDYFVIEDAEYGVYGENAGPTLSNGRIENGNRGIYLTGISPDISNLYIAGCAYGMELNNSSSAVTNLTAVNCSSYGVYSASGNPVFDQSTFTGNGQGLNFPSGAPVVKNSTITANGTGINLITTVTINSNTITDNTSHGINASGGSSNISGNTITGNGGNGVYGSFGTLDNNTITDNGGLGVICSGSPTVRKNSIKRNTGDGYNGSFTSFADNIISGNSGDGLNTASSNTISGNEIYDNGGDGVEASALPTLTNNAIYNNAGYELNATKQGSETLMAENNYWGLFNTTDIRADIHDYYTDGTTVRVDFEPFSSTPPPLVNISGLTACALPGAAVELSWVAHANAGYYLLYTDNGTGTLDTNTVWQTLDSTFTSYSTTLSDGDYRFAIRCRASDDRESALTETSVALDGTPPTIVAANVQVGDTMIVLTLSEEFDVATVLDTANWYISGGLQIKEIKTQIYDLFVGKNEGTISYYQNIGTANSPNFVLLEATFAGIETSHNIVQTFVDIDADGDQDLFIGGQNGIIHYYRNEGTVDNPNFVLLEATFASINVGYNSAPTFVDIDTDGDPDLFIGNENGNIHYYRNDGTARNPNFVLIDAISTGIDFGGYSAPTFVDIDSDGDPDLFIGKEYGNIHYYRNDGNATNPNFVLADANFAGIDIGSFSRPFFANINYRFKSNEIGLALTAPLENAEEEITVTAHLLRDRTGNSNSEVTLSFFPDDGNSNPVATLENVTPEHSGDITFTYTITDKEKDPVSIYPRFSTDGGTTWLQATVSGDTVGLDSTRYSGTLVWHTLIDLPGVEDHNVQFKLIPQDGDPRNVGVAAISKTFTVDNNQPPYAQLYEKPGKQKEDITLYFRFEDAENDSLSSEYWYKLEGLSSWRMASVTAAAKFASGKTDSLIWHTLTDIPNYTGNLWFKIEPSDYDPGITDSILLFVDNLGAPAITQISQFNGEQSGDLTLSYEIYDDENDVVNLRCEYSRDSLIWNLASVTGNTQDIDFANYSGSLIWHTVQDLSGIDDYSVWFRITPLDQHDGFAGMISAIHIDNNEKPSLAIGTLKEKQAAVVKVPATISDAENDTIRVVYQYRQDNDDWSDWIMENNEYFIGENYDDTLNIHFKETHGYGIYENITFNLLPIDNDSGNIEQTNPTSLYVFAGDYSNDIKINYDDLIIFANAWQDSITDLEIGPATGTPPLLIPQPDGKIDFEDLMVLAQQWNWSFDHPNFGHSKDAFLSMAETKGGKESKAQKLQFGQLENSRAKLLKFEKPLPPVELPEEKVENSGQLELQQSEYSPWEGQFGDQLTFFINSDQPVIGFSLEIEADPQQMSIENSENLLLSDADGFVFSGSDEKNGRMQVSAVALEKIGKEKISNGFFKLKVKFQAEEQIPIKVRWKLNTTGGAVLDEGAEEIDVKGFLALPKQFTLHQNFPNPFNPTTTIRYELPISGEVHLEIYNILGQRIAKLINQKQPAGYHQLLWQIQDTGYQATGLYILHIDVKAENGRRFTANKKMLLIK